MSPFNHLVSEIQCLFRLCSRGHYCPYHSSYRADKWICPSRRSFRHPSQLPGHRHFPLHGWKQDNESKTARIVSIQSAWLNSSCLEPFDDFDQAKLCQRWVCQEQSRPFSKQLHTIITILWSLSKLLPLTGARVSTFLVPEIHPSSPLCHESINSYSVHTSSLLMVVCSRSLVLRLRQQQQWHIARQLWYALVNLFWRRFGISIMLMMHWTLVIPVIS